MLYIFLSVRSAFGIGHYDFYVPLSTLLNYNLTKIPPPPKVLLIKVFVLGLLKFLAFYVHITAQQIIFPFRWVILWQQLL